MAKTQSSGRKPAKPEYSAEKNLSNQMDAAAALYKNDMTLQAIAEELSLNPIKVRKLLITAGVYQSYMAMLSILAFWCGCDEEQMDRIFRTSGLMRDKWDCKQAGTTYGAISIRNAVNTAASVYVPVNAQDIVDEEFSDLDPEAKNTEYQPDISKLTLSLEEMAPHTNPRYGRDEIGMGNMFADFFKPIARYNSERGSSTQVAHKAYEKFRIARFFTCFGSFRGKRKAPEPKPRCLCIHLVHFAPILPGPPAYEFCVFSHERGHRSPCDFTVEK